MRPTGSALTALTALIGVATVAVATTGLAVASTGMTAQTLTACYPATGSLRLATPTAPCTAAEGSVTWNQQGPPGQPGPPGPAGIPVAVRVQLPAVSLSRLDSGERDSNGCLPPVQDTRTSDPVNLDAGTYLVVPDQLQTALYPPADGSGSVSVSFVVRDTSTGFVLGHGQRALGRDSFVDADLPVLTVNSTSIAVEVTARITCGAGMVSTFGAVRLVRLSQAAR